MKNENEDVNNLINLNIQRHILEKELNDIKNDLNKEKKINLMSKEYIQVLESKIKELEDINEKHKTLLAENKKLSENLKATSRKCYYLSEKIDSIKTNSENLVSENKKLSENLKKNNELCNNISANNKTLEEKVSTLSEKINKKEKEYQDISKENKSLYAENEKLNELNKLYENSTSWKLTKPFRVLNNKFH